MAKLQDCIRIVYAILKEQLLQLSDVTKRYEWNPLVIYRQRLRVWLDINSFFILLFCFNCFRDWNEVDERYKIQEDKCVAMLSLGLRKMTLMSDKRDLVSLFHFDMLLLAVLDLFSNESHELKSLERRSMFLIDDILLAVKKDLRVCILCQLSANHMYHS